MWSSDQKRNGHQVGRMVEQENDIKPLPSNWPFAQYLTPVSCVASPPQRDRQIDRQTDTHTHTHTPSLTASHSEDHCPFPAQVPESIPMPSEATATLFTLQGLL